MDALQDVWPEATCYGCGPANQDGLRIKSYWSEDGRFVEAVFHPQPKYNAGFKNVMYGGLVASLIDCHSVGTAIAAIYRAESRPHGSEPIVTCVTGSLMIKYLKPTPLNEPIHLRAWVDGGIGRKTKILCELGTCREVTASGEVIAVQVPTDKSQGASKA
jgi:hypothetical protein